MQIKVKVYGKHRIKSYVKKKLRKDVQQQIIYPSDFSMISFGSFLLKMLPFFHLEKKRQCEYHGSVVKKRANFNKHKKDLR